MQLFTYEDLASNEIKHSVSAKQSFEIVGLSGRMSDAVSKIERIIETQGLSCRIYTYGRIATAGASLFGGITGMVGVASVVGMAAHNLLTFDPDYEVAKHIVDNKLTITYKRSDIVIGE